MKIVILEGSPNKNGSSNMLAEQFCKGRGMRNSGNDEPVKIFENVV